MTARLPRIPAGECGVWSAPYGIQPDSLQRDIVSRNGHGFDPDLLGSKPCWALSLFYFLRFGDTTPSAFMSAIPFRLGGKKSKRNKKRASMRMRREFLPCEMP